MTARDDLYLDLLKRSLLNCVYLDNELRIIYLRNCIGGSELFDSRVLHDIRRERAETYAEMTAGRADGRFLGRDIRNAGYSHTMIGRARLDMLHKCLDKVVVDGVPGDFVECGVWRGGSCIFMAGYLKVNPAEKRRIFVADSFDGLPAPSFEQDIGLDLSKVVYPELAVDDETVRENFRVYDLDSNAVVFVKGWFKDTLPQLQTCEIALLRLDGDLYESTMDSLEALYEKVSPGGIVIIDDYAIEQCRLAVEDYFARKSWDLPQMNKVDWTGVWFRKAA
ncbi:macrocin O-methyltransferase [Mesorhizobium sp. M1E.F.Ca.ET.045.02.1.1]|uniref:TylF/MycF/NovP-related O-methyltransferase n=1 Tax=Mesorhizobium sp. M1E.F.Ca.ET.045.02.1.1 TaxID=2493672 RepID=UPI000F75C484|nr:TylF/MycF/NovP-related O-methyltransferase [Mesorhizobium sp. M1E.F.Ca.ET.045.02.1.1]AZO25100.1 macrocin O-methyltransferase [Mesorhizobium sp. M1E.F.Ca.ET.045.02.1.1]TKB17952.1 MAG: macrocin O-methyltransferase [Mesorhizobium sp.]